MNNSIVIYILLAMAFFVAFGFTAISMPLARRVAKKIGAIDRPDAERRMHTSPTPRLGGLALFFGFLVSVLCFCDITRGLIGLLCGAVVIVMIGIFDDSRGLGAKFKLCMQIIAALIVIYVGDIKIDIFTNPNVFSPEKFLVLNNWVSVPVTVLWIVAITNAVNLIDGLDGLAAGISSIAAVSLVFVGIMVDKPEIALLAIIIAGACFGFLPSNFRKKRKMFLGDTGATFLGYTLAVLSIQGGFKSYAVISFAVPVLIFGLPIFDTLFAMLRRILTGKGVMTADRGHIHHRLVDMGFSKKQAVFILYAMSGVLGLTAVVLAESGALRALLLLIAALLVVFAGSVITDGKAKRHKDDETTQSDDTMQVVLDKIEHPQDVDITMQIGEDTTEDENL